MAIFNNQQKEEDAASEWSYQARCAENMTDLDYVEAADTEIVEVDDFSQGSWAWKSSSREFVDTMPKDEDGETIYEKMDPMYDRFR